jgi:hypothetical protein
VISLLALACIQPNGEASESTQVGDTHSGTDSGNCVLSVRPEVLDFESHSVGLEPQERLLMLRNSGDADCSLTDLLVDPVGEFEVGSVGSVVVPAGGESSMIVQFRPGDSGPREATLEIWAEELEVPLRVSLLGQGVLE